MTDDERAEAIAAHLLLESARPEAYFWLSFVDVSDPEDHRSLGATVVRARGVAGAAREAWDRGVNPGARSSVTRSPRRTRG